MTEKVIKKKRGRPKGSKNGASKVTRAPKSKKHNGPYPTKINYKQLEELCQIQCTAEECASVLNISCDTLDRRLKEDGHTGFADYFALKSGGGKVSLRRRQWLAAQDGNSAMLIWLGKQWLNQMEKQSLKHSGNAGITFNLDYGKKE